jgi:hypothetical protein
MKTFRDSANVDWTVFEVRRQITAAGDGSYLPSGFSDGWLCFECSVAKKRLVRYPEHWREFSDEDLEKLLAKAAPAPRTTFRIPDDLGESAPSRDY